MEDCPLQDHDTVIAEPDTCTAQKRLELLNFHIVRYDGLRAATANRASILLSADTLLLAALGLLFTSGTPHALRGYHIFSIMPVLAVASLILCSVYLALNAIVATGSKSSRGLYGAIPDRLLYNHSDIFNAYKDRAAPVEEFIKEALTLTYDRLLKGASAELWTVIQQQHRRYRYLRKAVNLFVVSAFVYPVAAFCILFPW